MSRIRSNRRFRERAMEHARAALYRANTTPSTQVRLAALAEARRALRRARQFAVAQPA